MKTPEQLICTYCQDAIELGEDHHKVDTENGTYHAHILCGNQALDKQAEEDEEHELQKQYQNRLIK